MGREIKAEDFGSFKRLNKKTTNWTLSSSGFFVKEKGRGEIMAQGKYRKEEVNKKRKKGESSDVKAYKESA